MNWVNWLGTTSYVLLAASYLVTNIFWLRVLAIVALTLEGAYFYWVGEGTLWVGIAWVGVFNAINLVQLAVLVWSSAKIRMSDDERRLQSGFFAGVDKISLRQLTSNGAFRTVPDQSFFLRQGEPVMEVGFLIQGCSQIDIDGELVEFLRPPGFLGEISFLTGQVSTVTAIAAGECRLFFIASDQLKDVAQACEPIGAAMHREFAVALAHTVQNADGLLKVQYENSAR